MSNTTRNGSEIAIGVLGFIVIGLIIAVVVLLVVEPASYADVDYPLEANAMAIEQTGDYGIVSATGPGYVEFTEDGYVPVYEYPGTID